MRKSILAALTRGSVQASDALRDFTRMVSLDRPFGRMKLEMRNKSIKPSCRANKNGPLRAAILLALDLVSKLTLFETGPVKRGPSSSLEFLLCHRLLNPKGLRLPCASVVPQVPHEIDGI